MPSARRRLADARAEVAKEEANLREAEEVRLAGERLISDGTAQMERAEGDYATIRTGPSATRN